VSETIVDRAELERRTFLSIASGQQSPRDIRRIVSNFASQLGSQIDLVDLIRDDGKKPLAAHTETIYHKTPLRYFILGCVRPSNLGGETTVFDARIAADLVAKEAPELASARIEYRSGSHRAHAVHQLVQTRSLRKGPRSVLVFRQHAYTNTILELPSKWTERTFYSFMDSVLAKSVATRHAWSVGDVLIVDNHVSLHSREPFTGARAMIRARILQ
jgi:alpha-ketoglutarate-dependent taurine dioxygenase